MEYKKADIEVWTGSEERVRLSAVPFHFNPGERALYSGADNAGAVIQRAGWLALQTEPFKGWQSAHILSLTGDRDSDFVFEVKRNFHQPLQEDDWLWFPVMPTSVEPYRD